MYEDFYGLTEEPFKVAPDPRFIYFSEYHEEGLRFLLDNLERKKEFIVLTGETGTGKSILINTLRTHIEEKDHLAILTDIDNKPEGILKFICNKFGLNINQTSEEHTYLKLKDFVRRCFLSRENCILILENSKDVSVEVFEKLIEISRFTEYEKARIVILLVGHPILQTTLNLLKCENTKSCISISYELLPLKAHEIEGYITHRLRVAGAPKSPFVGEAIEEIYQYSQGIPQLINRVCGLALSIGSGVQQREIGRPCVMQAIQQLGAEEPTRLHVQNAGTAQAVQVVSPVSVKPHEGASPQGPSNLSALPVLPSGTWTVKQIGARYGWKMSWRAISMSIAAVLVVGLMLGGAFVLREESQRSRGVTASMPLDRRRSDTPIARDDVAQEKPPVEDWGEMIVPADDAASVPDEVSQEKQFIRAMVTVQEGDTLEKIVLQTYGYVNQDLLLHVRAINPDMTDSAALEPNQIILLPLLAQ
jgi:general secretion pathway protein A